MLWKSDQNIGGANHADQDVVAAADRRRPGPDRSARRDLWAPTSRGRAPSSRPRTWSRSTAHYWVFYSGNWFNQPAYAIGAARCMGPPGPCVDISPLPLLGSNDQGQGPGEASVFADSSGVWMLYSPWRSLAPHPDFPSDRWSSPGSASPPPRPIWPPAGRPPSLDVLAARTLLSAP